jgi:16S rRNA (uracil1498-N3)-methyltransferase
MELGLIPYENAVGMNKTREVMEQLEGYHSIGVFIGPEGGFEEAEIELAKSNHLIPISLGRRILRTETAGLTILSMMVLMLEK